MLLLVKDKIFLEFLFLKFHNFKTAVVKASPEFERDRERDKTFIFIHKHKVYIYKKATK